jgi:hypothetical protein
MQKLSKGFLVMISIPSRCHSFGLPFKKKSRAAPELEIVSKSLPDGIRFIYLSIYDKFLIEIIFVQKMITHFHGNIVASRRASASENLRGAEKFRGAGPLRTRQPSSRKMTSSSSAGVFDSLYLRRVTPVTDCLPSSEPPSTRFPAC